jgi:hypothetical protein
MTTNDMHHDEGDYSASFDDVLVCGLAALAYGAVAAAIAFGLLLGLRYGLDFIGLALPDTTLAAYAVSAALIGIPSLVGLATLWKTYNRLMDLD